MSGALMVRLSAPCAAYFLPYVPGYSKADPTPTIHKSLHMSLLDQDVRFHLSASNAQGDTYVSHSLFLHDPLLLQMARAYDEELSIPGNTNVAQAQLYVMLSRFHRLLTAHRLPLANSAMTAPPLSSETINASAEELCHRTIDYIETRLGNRLSRVSIARAMGVSADHLGRLFHLATGTTLMRYVTQRRLEAAKLMLKEAPENIAEIAKLAGFTDASTFCAAFRRVEGVNPQAYRRRYQSTIRKNRQN